MTKRLKRNTNLTLHNSSTYKNLKVNNNNGPLIVEYISAIGGTLRRSLVEYPKTLVLRFDLQAAHWFTNMGPEVISKFFASLKAMIKADMNRRHILHTCHMRYVWVKEKKTASLPHYHVAIMLNNEAYNELGNYSGLDEGLAGMIRKAWASALGVHAVNTKGLVHFPKNPTYCLSVNSPDIKESFEDVLYRLSYFAKAETKNYGDKTNHFGRSQR
jgi:hypothetical protein